ncbi:MULTISPECIES: MFS transporter [Sphingobacterium]|jgi:MFS family permease|uniref:MFS transporter n=1 Tax=Sphingobacterium TaxID=28453 RepID=UPI00104C1B6B|nr:MULTISPECIES: MFS transporter [Sphingobacterium]MCS3556510.1 MFS family permease [Sphingobacterium sp. JUb21]MCW2263586.1 MFS family permease [Sphingobacterium kitahiroshimense]NJI74428.1 MFS transporter [Sphingobacterium sp. B16(2022)]TCQ99807.1 putative MFS family arabinose efflux permease [Sphingobacterium sp. JUb20]TCR06020.1 putative MFS family arabinose efflux permease [Sphingobacterium sp. JUb78]
MLSKSLQKAAQDYRFQIASYAILTFYGYFTIGLSLAVLPIFIHQTLGFNTIIAGAVIGSQYIMTFFMRAYAGTIVDKKGPKPAIIISMICFILTGILLWAAFSNSSSPLLALSLLAVSRLLTGCGEGMVGASPINWAILRVGEQHTSTAISYNGIFNYSSMAIGAPLGVLMSLHLGNWSIALLTTLVGLIGLITTINKKALYAISKEVRNSFFSVLKSVAPFGTGLALAGIGFGTISTFITLYYNYKGWENAAICITCFSTMFVLGRFVLTGSINKIGGVKIALYSMLIESVGLLLISFAPTPFVTIIGAAITGLGFSMVFPALGVEAVKSASSANKGAALGAYGLFIDISLGISGPLVGLVAKQFGMNYIFPFSLILVLSGVVVCIFLQKSKRNS